MIFKMTREKFGGKIDSSYCYLDRKMDHNIGLQEKFAENWLKSPKSVIITLTQDLLFYFHFSVSLFFNCFVCIYVQNSRWQSYHQHRKNSQRHG
jgi:hypothetical protein